MGITNNNNCATGPYIRIKTAFEIEPDKDEKIILLKKSILKTILNKVQKLQINLSDSVSDIDKGFLTFVVYINEYFYFRIFNKKLLVVRNGVSELLTDKNNTVKNSILKSVIGKNYDYIVKLNTLSNIFA